MPSSLIVAALGLEAGGLAAAAVTLGVRVLTTIAISSLISKDQPDTGQGNAQTGGQVQLPPATDNKLPVVYGDAWVSPIIVDARISADQQYMWYVLAFCEATDTGTISFGDVYWDDKILLFSKTVPGAIEGWYDAAGEQRVTGVAPDINMWFYRNGSSQRANYLARGLDSQNPTNVQTNVNAYDTAVMGDTAILDPWDNTYAMSNTAFAVVRVKYDQGHNITGLGQIKALVRNSLTLPGSCIKDYLMNDRYGCGVTDETYIDTTSLTALDTFAATNLSIVDTDNVATTNTFKYHTNGIVDTNNNCLSNLVAIANNADSWIQWNEATGKWGVVINRSLEESGYNTSTVRVITGSQIIGGININPLDLNNTKNEVNVQFPNGVIKHIKSDNTVEYTNINRGQSDYRYYALPNILRATNEPNNVLSMTLPLCNNSVQATWLAYKQLWSSRADLTIHFTMDYSGITIDAGDIICIKHDWYGWDTKAYGRSIYPGKPFRVTQITEAKSDDGFLSVQITAVAYNDDIYYETNPHYFTTVKFNGLTDPGIISKPDAPTIRDVNTASNTFVVQCDIPTTGNVIGMEFWYSLTTPEWIDNNYTLYSTQYYAAPGRGTLYPHYQTDGVTPFFEQVITVNLPPGDYYFKTRAVGPFNTSDFSEASDYGE